MKSTQRTNQNIQATRSYWLTNRYGLLCPNSEVRFDVYAHSFIGQNSKVSGLILNTLNLYPFMPEIALTGDNYVETNEYTYAIDNKENKQFKGRLQRYKAGKKKQKLLE